MRKFCGAAGKAAAPSLFNIKKHKKEMQYASRQHEQMEDLVRAEGGVAAVEAGELQGVHHASGGVYDPAREKQYKACRAYRAEYSAEGVDAYPAHSDIDDRREPLGAVYIENIEQSLERGERPYDYQGDPALRSADDRRADGRVGARYKHGNHNVVDFLKKGVHTGRNVESVVGGACRVKPYQTYSENKKRYYDLRGGG